MVVNHLLQANLVYQTNSGGKKEGLGDGGSYYAKNPPKTRHMRHTVLVLIREPILQDKSEMEGRFEGDKGGGREEEERKRG